MVFDTKQRMYVQNISLEMKCVFITFTSCYTIFKYLYIYIYCECGVLAMLTTVVGWMDVVGISNTHVSLSIYE